jgi:ALIX V-shaped domain binding to HIV/UBA/TS-N domain
MKNNSKINVLYSLKLHSDHRFANRSSNTNGTDYDTSQLSRLLADLSDLFRDINTSLTILKEEVTNYDIEEKVGVVDPNTPSADREYEIIVKKAQKSFSGTVYEIQRGLELQEGLLTKILEENDLFVVSTKNSHHDDIPIPLIEAAMHYIDEIIQNLRDGKNLYQKVLSELEYLDQQVGEASVRLTIERCEYEEKNTNSSYRIRQEEEDARMAVSLAGGRNPIPHSEQSNSTSRNLDRGYASSNPSSSHQSHSYPTSHPGFVTVDHRNPHVRIDDEKVASLVAMDFDPEKVVAALITHNNNVEQALNELLSGAAQQ